MLGIRLDDETETRLAAIARSRRQTKSQIARDAIRYWVARVDSLDRARSEWRDISDRERGDPDLAAMLDAGMGDLDLPE